MEPRKLQADQKNKTLDESNNKNVFLAFHRWVPVAPVGTSELAEFFRELNVPTMLIYGQKDTGLGHRYQRTEFFRELLYPPCWSMDKRTLVLDTGTREQSSS
jgi:hypothetical protein